MARLSRMTVTLIWPGYSSWSSTSRAISCERRTAASSSISFGLTSTRISRPAWRAETRAAPPGRGGVARVAPLLRGGHLPERLEPLDVLLQAFAARARPRGRDSVGGDQQH